MAVDLIHLVARFLSNEDVETSDAFFRTKVPQVAPEAYLHTIYKAVPSALVKEVSEQLRFPETVVEFYRNWNGAHLFVNALSVFGCIPSGAQLNRVDRFKVPPFDVREVNHELKAKLTRANLIALAAYSFDGSLVCVERATEEIVCFVGENTAEERIRWTSVDDWLEGEVTRISFLFDERGNRLVGKDQLLPASVRIT